MSGCHESSGQKANGLSEFHRVGRNRTTPVVKSVTSRTPGLSRNGAPIAQSERKRPSRHSAGGKSSLICTAHWSGNRGEIGAWQKTTIALANVSHYTHVKEIVPWFASGQLPVGCYVHLGGRRECGSAVRCERLLLLGRGKRGWTHRGGVVLTALGDARQSKRAKECSGWMATSGRQEGHSRILSFPAWDDKQELAREKIP